MSMKNEREQTQKNKRAIGSSVLMEDSAWLSVTFSTGKGLQNFKMIYLIILVKFLEADGAVLFLLVAQRAGWKILDKVLETKLAELGTFGIFSFFQ